MAPNLVKSGSMNSLSCLDLSNHIAPINLEPATTAAVFPPLVNLSTLIPPKGWNVETGARKKQISSVSRMKRTPSCIFTNLIEEEAQKTVSCADIEANLVADSNRRQDLDQECYENENKYDESYWDVPSNSCSAIEEKVLSIGQVEKLLVEDALRRLNDMKQQKNVVEDNHPNNSYWDWSSEPVLESEKKSNMIASIIYEESIRQQLSIDSITALEMSNKSNSNNSQIESASSAHVSVDYWYWNTEGEKADTEEIVAPHVYDPTHPNHAYWDFPAESNDPLALKEKLINSILKDESIRNLLRSDAVEDREVNYHRSRQEEEKVEYDCSPVHGQESVPSNYWDFDQDNRLPLLSQEQQEIINRILKEERQRHILSTQNIENNLCKEIKDKAAVEGVNLSASSDYWQW